MLVAWVNSAVSAHSAVTVCLGDLCPYDSSLFFSSNPPARREMVPRLYDEIFTTRTLIVWGLHFVTSMTILITNATIAINNAANRDEWTIIFPESHLASGGIDVTTGATGLPLRPKTM